MNGRYILDGHRTVLCPDLLTWATWFEQADRRVGESLVKGARISTMFLGLDHAFGHGGPLLFETMIFDGPHDGYCERYATWDEAVSGHARAVALADAKGAS